MADMPIIDHDKCQQCGLCASICACGALVADEKGSVSIIEVEKCGWCTLCELVCPYGAISCPFEIVIERKPDQD
ncbi:MAG TPA: 4Fe-4S dicluster domain-containing protein [Dehalococcoidales bacterium]|nr:4Fe-4S dicluster domain-containing protein [Dehalococcoidales bacterium]